MSERVIRVIPDTNTFLHFKRPDQIDLKQLLNCDGVEILITPVLVRELERQKVHNRSAKLRERAAATIKWLAPLSERAETVEIRPSIQLLFLRHSPLIEYAPHRLSHSIADDEFIAHAIEYRSSNKSDVVILTDDMGLRIKAPAHGIRTVAPKETDRLPPELDQTEKEIAALKKELASLQLRIPKLSLTFRDGKDHADFVIPKLFVGPLPRTDPPYSVGDDIGKWREEAERRREYQERLRKWDNELDQHMSIKLTLENKGKAPANDVLVEISVPDILIPYAEQQMPSYPNPGTPPAPIAHSTIRPVVEETQEFSLNLDSDFNEVSFRINKLVQHRKCYLGWFYVKFRDIKTVQSFTLNCRMTCAELPEPHEAKLHVIASFEGFSHTKE